MALPVSRRAATLFPLLLVVSAGCSALPVGGARVDAVDVELAKRVLSEEGFQNLEVRQQEFTREDMVDLLRSAGLPVNDHQDAHASITTVEGTKDPGGVAHISLMQTSTPCWPEDASVQYDSLVGEFRWGQTVHEVSSWCFFVDAAPGKAKLCGQRLMEALLDSAGRDLR